MENYEQKYREALERAKRCHKDLSNLHGVVATMSKDFFEEVFPELKESEDEKMIRIIIKTLQDINKKDNSMMGDILLEDCIAWLEKKGEKSNIHQDTEDDLRCQSTIQVLEYARSLDAYNQYGKESIDKDIAWLEKKGEQKECPSWIERHKDRGFLSVDEEYILNRIIEYLEDNECPSEWIDLMHDIFCLPYQKQSVFDNTDRKAIVREMQDELERLASVYDICLPDSRHDIYTLCDELYWFISKRERRNSVECMDLTNEFENQVSHLLASVLNGEWDYTEDFVRYAAKQLMGYARYEMGKESSEHPECEGIILSEYDGAMIDLITKALCELEEIHDSESDGNAHGQYHSEREWLKSLRERLQSYHKIEFCSKCPFGETVSDPDPRDWFCRDDETVRCKKLNRDIASSIRPYQVGKVDTVPDDCPIKSHGTCENGIASNQ